MLNGVPVVLETGVQVVRPISIEYAGQGLFQGRQEQIEIRLKSNLDRPIAGTVSLDSHPGLHGSGSSLEFTLPARLSTQCVFALTGIESGTCVSNLRYRSERIWVAAAGISDLRIYRAGCVDRYGVRRGDRS